MKTKRRQVCTYRLSFNGSLCLLIIGKVRPDLAIRTIWNCERKLWKNICSFWKCDSVVITPYAPYIKYLKQPAYKIKEGRGKLFFYMKNYFQTLYLIRHNITIKAPSWWVLWQMWILKNKYELLNFWSQFGSFCCTIQCAVSWWLTWV